MAMLPGLLTFLGVMALSLAVAHLLLKFSTFARLIESETGRFETLDGLRGFLALSVFVHHFAVHSAYAAGQGWKAPSDPFLAMSGSAPVQIFFAITGFLFWSRAIRDGGNVAVRSFAINRFFRIAPMYLLVMAIALSLAVIQTNGIWNGEGYETYQAILRTLTCGAFVVDYFNGVDMTPITARVSWTLVFEWGFYAALPFIAWFAKLPRFFLLASAFLALLALSPRYEMIYATLFLVGMIVAHVVAVVPKTSWAQNRMVDASLAILFFGLFMAKRFEPYATGFLFVLPILLAVTYGASLFGLFRRPESKLLGSASYSIYLIHGPLIYIVLRNLVGYERFVRLPPVWQLAIEATLCVAVVILACLSYAFVERPMISLGHRLAKPTRVLSQ